MLSTDVVIKTLKVYSTVYRQYDYVLYYVLILCITGIITQSALSQLFPRYASKMLVDFLQFMKLCQEIDNNFLKSTNLVTKDRQTSPEDKLLFFPAAALVRKEGKPHLVNQKFSFGWCLQCLKYCPAIGHFPDFVWTKLHLTGQII